MGKVYFGGLGVEKDEAEAFELYLKTAEQDLCEAQYCVAFCYAKGVGMGKSMELACEWFRKAIEKDYTLSEEEQKNII